ncbi:unnamed protein product [Adineta steineri]|uniref:G-protein coupled receptors family 1 profile domain-containing protein n=1 Tax=Adineta steineri TaxID=433720 RepID=A0A815U9T6_9BILA|nr:unnamed protein product [Adineta steineri]CAF1648099.1 unnamed protein product [Adineta steineri]
MIQLDIISHQLTIIIGIIMFIFGLIGNILNICIFTNWSRSRRTTINNNNNNRTNNSSLYLLVSSIANLILIIYALPTRILFDGYQYQVTQRDVFILCKFRYYVMHTCDIISLTCVCMATFDRYLISSRNVRLRHMSTTRQGTKFIIFLIIFILGLHSIPLIIYYNVSTTGQCIIYFSIYLSYYRYTFQIFFHGIIPIIFFSLFSFLTFKQLKTLTTKKTTNNNINIDKQLSRMLFLMSITIVLSCIPYSVESIYYLIFADSSQKQTSYILLFHIISSLLFYTNPVCSFYVYYISTSNFRSQTRKIILCKKDFNHFMNNQIRPITISNNLQQ